MTRSKIQLNLAIKELLDKRYAVDSIAAKLGVSRGTVFRYINKQRAEAQRWFEDLASKDFIPEFKNIADRLNDGIKQYYEQMERTEQTYSRLIEDARNLKAEAANEKEDIKYKIQLDKEISKLEKNRLKSLDDCIKMIQNFEIKRGQLLNKTIMVHSIERAIKKKSLQPEPMPQIGALKIS